MSSLPPPTAAVDCGSIAPGWQYHNDIMGRALRVWSQEIPDLRARGGKQMAFQGDEPITLDRGDDLYSVHAKLDSASGGRPFVVLASDCRLARSVLTYKLLARASERFGTPPLAVVAGNPAWRQMAREHGLRAYGSVGSLRRARRQSILSLPEGLADSFVCRLHLSLARLVVLATLLLGGGATVCLAVPVMRVTVSTSVEQLDREIIVRVDVGAEAADLPSTTIPGRILERRLAVSDFIETTGGTNAGARIVSADDRTRLQEALIERLQAQALDEMMPRVRQSESLIPHSLQVRVEGEEYDGAVDEEADRLKGTVYGLATDIAFANQDFNSLVDQEWRRSTPSGYRALAGGVSMSPPEVFDAGLRTAKLLVKVSGRAERVLEADEVAKGLRGMSVEEAKARLASLELPMRLESLEMWPEWAPSAQRIEVELLQGERRPWTGEIARSSWPLAILPILSRAR
jgi:hypothetical protein